MSQSTPGPTGHGFADDAERYRLDSRIATGGMGEVWRATDTSLGREVAVKVLKSEYADDPTFRSRFETEARHAAALSHPGIAGVFDVGEKASSDGSPHPRPFLVMELVDGQPLSTLLQDGRDLDPDAVRDLMAQVGDALGAAHRAGIVHRDVKPANLIVTPGGQVKVTDFGIARAADTAQITRTGAVMGTPQYLSPEQAEGRAATAASDVYALGVVAFECLAGRRPFEAESSVATALAHVREPVPELPDSVPRDLANVVRTALAKDPAERYADGSAFAVALRDPAGAGVASAPDDAGNTRTQVLGGVAPAAAAPAAASAAAARPAAPPAGPPTPPSERESTTSRRNTAWPAVVAVVLAAVLALVLALWLFGGGDDDEAPTAGPTTSAPTEPTREPTPTQEPEPEPTQEPPPETVTVTESDYLGRDVDAVAAELSNMGLQVRRDEQPNQDPGAEGEVTGVDPTGALSPGQVVTVSYNGPAPEPEPEPSPSPPSSPGPTPPGSPTGPPTSPGVPRVSPSVPPTVEPGAEGSTGSDGSADAAEGGRG